MRFHGEIQADRYHIPDMIIKSHQATTLLNEFATRKRSDTGLKLVADSFVPFLNTRITSADSQSEGWVPERHWETTGGHDRKT